MSAWQFPLRRGPSPDPAKGACLFDAVSWVVYGRLGDHPECVDPVLNAYGIQLNDWLPYAERQRLVPFIPLLAGTNNGHELAERRRHLILDRANEIARQAGLVIMRDRALVPSEAYERALHCVTWSERDRRLYTPAIALLGEAIRLGARAAPPLADDQVAAGVIRFRMARAA